MPRKRRAGKVPTPPWEVAGRSDLWGHPGRLAALLGVVLLLLAGAGLAIFSVARGYWEEFTRPGSLALQVADSRYSLRYFKERLALYVQQVGGAGSQAAQPANAIPSVADRIIEEEILYRYAGELGVSVSPSEIEEAIRERLGLLPPAETPPAQGGDQPPSPTPPVPSPTPDPFQQLYSQELERTGLTDEEYRRIVGGELLAQKALDHLQQQVPDNMESVHFRQIVLQEAARADQIIGRIQGGEDFAAVARQESIDTRTRGQGGEVGWVPRGAMNDDLANVIFALEPGGVGKYIHPETGLVFIVQVLEKDSNRALGPGEKQLVALKRYRDWVQEKRRGLTIVNHMDLANGDQTKIRWVVDQVY